MTLSSGHEIAPTDLADLLAAAGYSRQDPVDEHGEFCVRGGVVDFFPAGAREPIRLEFVGDTIESIRSYDPATQRSTAALDQAAIAAVAGGRRRSGSRRIASATVFDHLWARGPADGVSSRSQTKSDRRGEKMTEQIQRSYDEATARGNRVRRTIGYRCSRWDDVGGVAGGGNRARDAVDRGGSQHIALSAGAGIRRPRARLGGRDPAQPRARRNDGLRRALPGSRRAHDRSACRLRNLRRTDRRRRRGPHRLGPGRRRPPVARVPAAGRGAAVLGRDRRFRGRTQDARAAPVGDPNVPL